MKVVVTGGQFPAALAAVRSLSAEGFRTVGISTTRTGYVRFSRATPEILLAPDVSRSASRFVETVAKACSDEEPTLVLPGTEQELLALVAWRRLLPPWVRGLPNASQLDAVTDRIGINELAAKLGITIPETTLLEPGSGGEGAPLPAVIKPARTAFVKGDTVVGSSAICVDDERQLAAARAQLEGVTLLAQPRLEADLYGLAGVMWKGSLLAPVQQVALSIFPSPCGGSALARSVPIDVDLRERLERLLAELGWEGVVQLQWLAADGEAALIDINPRIYGSLALANAAGSPLAAIWAKLVFGLPWHDRPNRDVLYRNLETFARARPTTAAAREWPPPQLVASSVLDRSDPLPVLASVLRGVGKIRRDMRKRG
jgi:predicted ATP-grasp superfamily ATP-dependent carboligase